VNLVAAHSPRRNGGGRLWHRGTEEEAAEEEEQQQQRRRLAENLRTRGWSRLRLRVAATAAAEPTTVTGGGDDGEEEEEEIVRRCLRRHGRWRDDVADLFAAEGGAEQQQQQQQQEEEGHHHPRLSFFASESGGEAGFAAEPKQSWEWRRGGSEGGEAEASGEGSLVARRMRRWTAVLHSVAVAVCRALELPGGALLSNPSDGSLDRLRAFRYDDGAASAPSSSQEDGGLGSSQHTDWGSFTVVWQDDVGGLQTYCRTCDVWNDVAPTPSAQLAADDAVEFVVHLSDVTSLALRCAAGGGGGAEEEEEEVAPPDAAEDGATAARSSSWPSPLHRVVSPVNSTRCSLVYFCYPPPHMTLDGIARQLAPWCNEKQRNVQRPAAAIPYEHYYLLRNQSGKEEGAAAAADEVRRGAAEQFQRIRSMPLRQVLEEKWRQVQR
jgi:hypothetical protein